MDFVALVLWKVQLGREGEAGNFFDSFEAGASLPRFRQTFGISIRGSIHILIFQLPVSSLVADRICDWLTDLLNHNSVSQNWIEAHKGSSAHSRLDQSRGLRDRK